MPNKGQLLQELTDYLEYLKMSGVEYLPKAAVKEQIPALDKKESIVKESDKTQAAAAPKTLEEIQKELGDCTKCRLHEERKKIVFGVGNVHADLVFVGEAPGRDEDVQGEPFVGKSGQLLTKIIQAIDLQREDVYICNVIKCRPPQNRNPLPKEIETCEPYLLKQIESIRPKVICTLGKFAAQTLLKTDAPISALRGNFHNYHGIPLMPTFHPAFLLRNPKSKKEVWEDIQQVQKVMLGRLDPPLL